MTIQVELSPETEARLAAEAQALGMDLAAYAGKVLEENTPLSNGSRGILKPVDVEEITRILTEGADDLPVLTIEVNDRASYYEERG